MAFDVSFACPDWFDRLKAGRPPIPDLPLDEVRAGAAVDLLNKLRVPDIAGQPTFGEVGGEWVRDITRAGFGAINPETRKPYVREIFTLVPKKNGKTTLAGALGLVWLMINRVPNVDGVIIGPTIEVAQKCFDQITAMIAADGYLSKRFHVIGHKRTIVDLHKDEVTGVRRNAKLKIKSFDPKVVTGSIPAFAILDELHLMAEDHAAGRVIGQIRGGMITNEESLLIIITTQSEIPPTGVFLEELTYARKIRDGEITERVRMLPVLYEFPVDMQADEEKPWKNTDLWPLVLPNLGRGFDLGELVVLQQQAEAKGAAEIARWASQHLNIQIGIGLGGDGWAGARHWLACTDRELTGLDRVLARSEVCTIGIDWGGADDLAALYVLGREAGSKLWLGWMQAWARPSVFQQRRLIEPQLRDFERQGDLVICQTGEEQAAAAADICQRVHEAGLLPEASGIGIDSAGVALLLDALSDAELTFPLVQAVGQGWKLQTAISTLPLKLEGRRFRHGGQPLMTWAVGNARQELRGSNYVVTKAQAGSAKIDPLMALFNASMLMFLNPAPAQGRSFWEAM